MGVFSDSFQKGFTLIELMVTVTVLTILLAIGVPSMMNMLDREKVVAAAQEVRHDMALAKQTSIVISDSIFMNFAAGGGAAGAWSYGFGLVANCDLSTGQSAVDASSGANDCVVPVDANGDGDTEDATDWQVHRSLGSKHSDISMSISGDEPEFDGVRGTLASTPPFAVALSLDDYALTVKVTGVVGRISICTSGSTALSGYDAC